ncbi:YxeA family protein [Lacticaseibacillus baoqingensis]|uniref:YxeA family protein n=1 Tax=Lacticaseibacillus baoqingensis TaxID=2486013 RepID=A0ABW4E2Q7_9LACO|nr:YxeA family protein [Lacticaseibacillus baoqingensis]
MKRFLIGLVVLLVLIFGGLKLYAITNYGGTTYYTKITTTGTKIAPHDANGNVHLDYRYEQTGYDENGRAQSLTFNANKARPLRQQAYLKLTYNDKKGVTSWEAVSATDVPKKALTKLAAQP